MGNRILYLLAFAFVWVACQPKQAPYMRLTGEAQGTTFSITYRDSLSRNFDKPVDSLFHLIDRSMSLWDSTSLISRINRNDSVTAVDSHFAAVFHLAQQISRETEGAFDITVGPLVKAWGFSAKKNNTLPDSSTIDSLREIIGYQLVKLEGMRLIKSDPTVELDFNAIAQGYTVDLIATFLERHAIRDYLIELGGEVRARGKNERKETWQIGIDKPIDSIGSERPLQIIVPLQNESLATSGSYRKFKEAGGVRRSHIIDPATGYPVTHQLISVSVIADHCAAADAYATACMVAGLDRAMEMASRLGLKIYCIYLAEDGALMTKASEDFPL